jgi:hypothetical protein
MINILVALLLNNHILVEYSNNIIDEIKIMNLKELLETHQTNDIMDVDKIVKKYMLTYGIDKVRGGSYKNDILEEWQIKSLENELKLLKPSEVSSLDEFANSYDINNISNVISEIIHFRTNILKLKEIDTATQLNYDINNINIALSKNDKRDKLSIEYNEYNSNRRMNNLDSLTRDKLIKIEQEIKELNEDITKLINGPYINNIIIDIDNRYNNYLRYSGNNLIETNHIIKLYSTKIFNIEVKQKIKDFNSPYGSTEEEILEKYKALLKRKLNLISYND